MEAILVAYGFEYLVMAVNNARSIRRTNPEVSVTLVTNVPLGWQEVLARDFDRLEFRDEPSSANRSAKLDVFGTSRADRVLYLDADAEVRGDLTPAFRMLADHDVLIRPFDLPSKFAHAIGPGMDGQQYPQYWGGMFFFRRTDEVQRFFTRWQDRFRTAGIARDQPALARAIHDSPELRVLPMNAMWGIFSADLPRYPPDRPAPRIYHYADVSNDAALLTACSAIAEELRSTIDVPAEWEAEVEETVRRLQRMGSLWFRSPLLNRPARRAWRTIDRLHGRPATDVRKKRPNVEGRSLGRESRTELWPD